MDTQPRLTKVTALDYWDRLLSEKHEVLTQLLEFDANRSRQEKIDFFCRNIAIINIETSTACNRTCSYCPDSIYDRKKQNFIPAQAWSRVLSNLKESGYDSMLSLNLYNEPLLDENIYTKLAELKSAAPQSTLLFHSNGDFINTQTLEKLSQAGLDMIYISLHTPKGKKYEDAHQLRSFRKFFKRINKDLVIMEHCPNERIRAETHYKKIKIVVRSSNWDDYGTDRGGIVDKLSEISRESPCMRVFREFTISNTGDVFPCCQIFPDAKSSQDYILGNLGDQDIFEIYSSKKAVEWRRGLFDFSKKTTPCCTCSDPDHANPESNIERQTLLTPNTVNNS